jgi:hypothetical protein
MEEQETVANAVRGCAWRWVMASRCSGGCGRDMDSWISRCVCDRLLKRGRDLDAVSIASRVGVSTRCAVRTHLDRAVDWRDRGDFYSDRP